MNKQLQNYKNQFRGYDIRGVYPTGVNEELARLIGHIFSRVGKRVVVGHDVREGSKRIADAFSHAAVRSGCRVTTIGEVPNPVCMYYALHHNMHGVYITASHNPKAYNGIKIITPQGVTDTHALALLEKHLGEQKMGSGSLKKDVHAIEEYLRFVLKQFEYLPVKVAVDCMHGMAGTIIEHFAKRSGMRITLLNQEPRADFGGKTPEPTPESVHDLAKTVVEEHCDFGVAFDGDVDRALFVDNRGKPIRGDRMGVILAKKLFRQNRVAATINCSNAIKSLKKVTITPIGRPHLERLIAQKKARFAFELSSHFYFATHYPFSDGFLAMLYTAKLAQKTTLSKERLKLPLYYDLHETYRYASYEEMQDAFEELRAQYQKKYARTNTLDGIRVDTKTSWILLRPSNTEPVIRLTIEAKTYARAQRLLHAFNEIRKKLQ